MFKPFKFTLFFLGILSIPFLSACESPYSAVNRTRGGVNGEGTTSKIGDLVFHHWLKIVDLKYRKNGNLTQIQATLENLTSNRIKGEIQFRWYDEKGWRISDVTSTWELMIVNGKDQIVLTRSAASPQAKEVEIVVKDYKPIK